MRIGLVIYGSLNGRSGGYLYDRRLVEWLRRRGDQVEIVSLPRRRYGHSLLDNVSSALLERLRWARFDLLLEDELNHPSLFWLNRRLRRRVDYPIVAIVHHLRASERRSVWQNWLYRHIERAYLRSVDGYVLNSNTTRGAVVGLVGGARPCVVAYPGGDRLGPAIEEQRLQARLDRRGPLRLVFVGNVIPRKGLHTLIAALATLHRDDWRLTVIGSRSVDARYARGVRRQISAHGLMGRVYFRSSVSDVELAGELEASDALVVPSSYEGFGIVYLEGMAFGLPAVASTGGGACEIISHGRNGFLVPPDDAAALARYLSTLLDERATTLRTMSHAARARFETHPTWDDGARTIGEFLDHFSTREVT